MFSSQLNAFWPILKMNNSNSDPLLTPTWPLLLIHIDVMQLFWFIEMWIMVLTWNLIADMDMSFVTRVELSGSRRNRRVGVYYGMSATLYIRIGAEID